MKKKQSGSALIEYALTVALIAVVSVASIQKLGMQISSRYECNVSSLEAGDELCNRPGGTGGH